MTEIKVGQRYNFNHGSTIYTVEQIFTDSDQVLLRVDAGHRYIECLENIRDRAYNLLPEPLPKAAFPFWVNIFPDAPGVSTHTLRPLGYGAPGYGSGVYDRAALLRIDLDSSGNPTITREEI